MAFFLESNSLKNHSVFSVNTFIGESMKRKSFFLILIVALCSCSGVTTRDSKEYYGQVETRKHQIWAWASGERAKVEAGTLKNSEYWKLFFKKSIELRPDLDNYLFFANEMIKVSRIFEEGKITRAQFEYKNLQLTALLNQEDSRRAATLLPIQLLNNYELDRYETALFTSYRNSLFLDYVSSLHRQLSEAGPQFSTAHCAVFENSIQCTPMDPAFP